LLAIFLLLNNHLQTLAASFGQPKIVQLPAAINQTSKDPVDQAILTFAPIGHFYPGEDHLPLTMESYIQDTKTGVFYKPEHRTDPKNPQIVIQPGQVTMEKLGNPKNFENFANPGNSLWIEGDNHFNVGENPTTVYKIPDGKSFTAESAKGVIQTPYYAVYTETAGHDYIQYFFFYGYNGDYKVVPGVKITGVGYHRMDLEHMTLQFEKGTIKKNNPKLLRIGFFAHGGGEGKWLKADNKDLAWDGKHIKAYMAFHGHGVYPITGVHVRLYSFGSDWLSDKGKIWRPQAIIRLYKTNEKGYDQKTMGWVAFPGDLGPEGVGGLVEKNYFTKGPGWEDGGQDYEAFLCADDGNSFSNQICRARKAVTATIPVSLQIKIANNTLFTKKNMPPAEMVVAVGDTLKFAQEVPIKTTEGALTRKSTGKVEDVTFTAPGKAYVVIAEKGKDKELTISVR
jgi:hypothetical protein